jgi:hypothetical protein
MEIKRYLGDRVLDNLLIREIGFVANKELVHALGRITVNLLQPLLDVRKGICPKEWLSHA